MCRRSARRRSRSSNAAGRRCGWRSRRRAARPAMSGRAQAVLDTLSARGALFFDELAEATRLLRPQLEEALGELVALGLAASDSFGGLRALLVPSGQRKPLAGAKRRGRVLSFDIESGGRWAMINRARADQRRRARDAAVEYAARTLLARYGVVFWRLLDARARVAAAVAGSPARLPPARGAGRNSRRPIRRRLLGRAIRACRTRSDSCARCADDRRRANGCRCRAPIRSI